ncbi:MAG: c-type cytochrome [Planctomycetales bacterium]
MQVQRGQAVFERLDCQRCHAPPSYTSPATYDVGLEDELGNSQFNPPSLRGVSQRDGLLHDNRARTLEEVFQTHQHQTPSDLGDQDLADLVRFLRSL